MTSILTNTGAMVALQSLSATQKSLSDTNNHISTGLKVQTAKDDASSWTIATTMKSNVASLNQVSQGLGNADSILGTAVSGLNQVSSLVSQIRSKVASFTDSSQDQTSIQKQVDQLTAQIGAVIKSSSFNGVNLLDNDSGTGKDAKVFVASTNNDYTSTATGQDTSTTIKTGDSINLDASASAATTATDAAVTGFTSLVTSLSGTITGADAATKQTALDGALKTIDTYAAKVKSQAAQFGAVQQNVESQQTFINNLSDTLTSGVSNMVDADMTKESARLSALQTQQQLGTQALSIANQAPQMILKLFG